MVKTLLTWQIQRITFITDLETDCLPEILNQEREGPITSSAKMVLEVNQWLKIHIIKTNR